MIGRFLIALDSRHVSVRSKLTVALSALIATIALFIYLYFPARLKQQATEALISRAKGISEMTAYSASPALYFNDSLAGEQVANGALKDATVTYVRIEDSDGRLFTQVSPGLAHHHVYRLDSAHSEFTEDGCTYRTQNDIEFNGQEIGTLFMGFDAEPLEALVENSRSAVGLLSLAVLVVGIIVVFIISTMISGPLMRMVDVAEDIARGNLSRRVESGTGSEIGRLATSFNNMVASLQSAQHELSEQNRHLEERVESRTKDLVQEVSERRRAEDALEAQHTFLRQVIDINPNFVFVKDREGRFTLVNEAVAEAYGTTVKDLVGKTDADFNANTTEVEAFRRDDLQVMNSLEERFIAEEPITDSSGKLRWLQTIKRPLHASDGTVGHVLGVATDITVRKQAEEALRTSEEQLRQAQKMEAIGKLAGGVAHDFNNILAVIMGRCEIMLATMRPEDPLLAPVKEVDAAASRASALTRQLLAFSRRQVLEARPLSLNACVENMKTMLQRLIGEHIELRASLNPAAGTVLADPGQIEQVIMNLAVNARDAMPNGGTLTMSTGNIDVDGVKTRLSADIAPGQYVYIAVSDTGHGMDESTCSRIFEPFFTTKAAGKGTGLGLSTVYGIVKQSSGHVLVESTPGKGTTFTVLLPRSEAVVEESEVPNAATASLTAHRGQTILLIEDEEGVRQLVDQTLTMAGYKILTASNGVEAMKRIRTDSRIIDLVITDVIMPGLSGPDVVSQIQKTRPDIRVIFMSGYADLGVVNDDILAAGHALLQKPFRLDNLRTLVADTLGSSKTPVACEEV